MKPIFLTFFSILVSITNAQDMMPSNPEWTWEAIGSDFSYNKIEVIDFNEDGSDELLVYDLVSLASQGQSGSFSRVLVFNQDLETLYCEMLLKGGLLDIYVCRSGNFTPDRRKNELLINKGPDAAGVPHFEEMGSAFGLDDDSYSTQASFFDYDLDGDLDVYLLNHNIHRTNDNELERLKNDRHPYVGDKLFRNNMNTGQMSFTDVSDAAGISGNALSYGLGVSVGDLNQDGWPDIYVSL